MQNKKTKQLLCALLAALLLSSCAQAEPKETREEPDIENAAQETQSEETQSEDNLPPAPEIEAVDCGGDDYVFLARQSDGVAIGYMYNELTGDLEGDVIDSAILTRNLAIEEKYNLTLLPVYTTRNEIANMVRQEIRANTQTYDLVMPMVMDGMPVAVEGAFHNMNEVPYIDRSKPWWFSTLIDDLSIAGKNYQYAGDTNLNMLNGISAVYFNKGMAADLGLDDPYQLVLEGTWTYETMEAMCEAATADTNGDGVYGYDDRMGLTLNSYAWAPLFYGTGSLFIAKDESGTPFMDTENERSISVLQDLCAFLNNDRAVILVNQHPELESMGWGNANLNMFMDDRALFYIEVAYAMASLRSMETDFGIIPMPKYQQSDEAYHTHVHHGHSSTIAIPVTNADLDLAGRILEDMAYESYIRVRPAYYDVTLQGKTARDPIAAEMLDIVYSGFRMDLALALSSSGIDMDNTVREIMVENRSDVVSSLKKKQKVNDSALRKVTEKIAALP